MFFGVAAIVWLLTLTQLGGTKYTARISKVGFVGGIIVPVLVLLVGLVIYFATGGVSQINMDAATFVPELRQGGHAGDLRVVHPGVHGRGGVRLARERAEEPEPQLPAGHDRAGHPHHRCWMRLGGLAVATTLAGVRCWTATCRSA